MSKRYTTNFLVDTNGNTGASGQVLISTSTGVNWSDGSDITGGPYLPLSAGSSFPLTGGLHGTSASFSGDITANDYIKLAGRIVNTVSKTSRTIITGGNEATSGEGAYVSIEGVDYGGVGLGGDVIVQTPSGAGSLRANSVLEVLGSGDSYFTGDVGIGITGPTRKFEVVSSAGIVGVFTSTTGGSYTTYEDSSTSGDNQVRFGAIGDKASIWAGASERISINTTGGVKFNTYGVGFLVTDASGNITASTSGYGGPYLPLAGGVITGPVELQDGSDVWGQIEPNERHVSELTYAEAGSVGMAGTIFTDAYGESDLTGIMDDTTFTYSAVITALEAVGARLPTLAEVMDGVGKGSGQGYDSEFIWTSTHAGHNEVWVCMGSYLNNTANRKVVDITDALEVYRTRGVFDVSKGNRPVTYMSTGDIDVGSSDITAGAIQIGSTAGYTTINTGAFFSKGGGSMFTGNVLAGAATNKIFKIQRNDVEKFSIGLDVSDNLAFINSSGTSVASVSSSGNTALTGTLAVSGSGDSYFTGNLGVGVSGATARLQIKTTDSINAFRIQNSNDVVGFAMSSHTTQGSYFQVYDAAGVQTIKLDARTDSTSRHTIFNGGGNVGIGTTNPQNAKLVVAGEGVDIESSTHSLRLRFYEGTTFKAGFQSVLNIGEMISGSAIGDLAIRSQSNILFATGGSTKKMQIDSSGNVSIGDVAGVKLSISGGVGTTNGTALLPTHTFYSDKNTGMYRPGADILGFSTAGSEKMRILSNGNVGIGVTNPSSPFTVEYDNLISNHTPAVLLKSSNSLSGSGDVLDVYSARGDGFTDGYIARFGNQVGTKMYIRGDGNVGIGTTSISGLLHIKKDNATATFEIQGGLNTNTTTGAITSEINFGANDTSTTGGIATSIKSVAQISNGAHNGLAFYTGLQSRTPYLEQMLYFTAQGGLSFGDTLTAFGSSGQVLKSNGDAPPTWVAASTVIGGPYLPLTAGSGYPLTGPLTGTSARFSGNVGVGVNPYTELDVLGDINSSTGFFLDRTTALPNGSMSLKHSSGTTGGKTIMNSELGSLLLGSEGASDALLINKTTGNISIGGSSNTYKLDVTGTGRFTSTLQVDGDATFTQGVKIEGNAKNLIISNTDETDAGVVFTDQQAGTTQAAAIKFNSGDNKLKFFVNDEVAQRMVIDTSGNVGIGITNPNALLKIRTLTNGDGMVIQRNTTTQNDYAELGFALTTNDAGVSNMWVRGSRGAAWGTNYLTFGTADTERIRIAGNGFVGIGQTNPTSYKLDVSGTIRATGDVIAYSDARVKDNVETVENALDKVNQLRGVSYTRNDIEDKTTKIGVIAQEVLEVLPEVVQQDDEGKYSVAYGNMVGLLVEAIKEQDKKIERLEGLVELMLKDKKL